MDRIFMRRPLIITSLLACITVVLVSCRAPYCKGSRISYDDKYMPIPIMSCGSADVQDMVSFFLATNSVANVNQVTQIAELYIKEAAIENVNHDIAFCQMCVETNYLRFGGDVKALQNNFCGIGATGGGASGASFKTARIGIRAHIQHLKAYASTGSLHRKLVDPRFDHVRRGSAPYVNDLTGKWAVDLLYGAKMKKKLQVLAGYL